MNIVICGSMALAKEILQLKNKLRDLNWQVEVPANLEAYVDNPVAVESKWKKIEGDLIRNYFQKIKAADAVLIANYEKNGVPGYIGGNALIEMAFAYVLEKPLYLINQAPQGLSYSDEILAMQPIVLEGDVSKIRR